MSSGAWMRGQMSIQWPGGVVQLNTTCPMRSGLGSPPTGRLWDEDDDNSVPDSSRTTPTFPFPRLSLPPQPQTPNPRHPPPTPVPSAPIPEGWMSLPEQSGEAAESRQPARARQSIGHGTLRIRAFVRPSTRED